MIPLYFIGYDNDTRPHSRQPAGSVAFSPESISLLKAADGAILQLRYTVHLASGVHVSIAGISTEVAFEAQLSPTPPLPLGLAVDPRCYVIDTNYEFPHGRVRQSTIGGQLQLPLTFVALEALERRRQGAPPRFTISMHASALVRDVRDGLYQACRLECDGGGPITLHVERDMWIQQLRNVSPMGSVLVEIPLAVERMTPWDTVWAFIERAQANLAQGGEAGWKNCVSEVRQALDAWRTIDHFGTAPVEGARQWDKRRRLQHVADALFHLSSLSVHSDEHRTRWTREDAIMALSTLCALLAARNP